ncbi:hypothetical protein Q4567_13670 [Aliiglaciecola sp. 2_MG-2023]|uniref:hypothetical protein n=1 Tax=Alteromonadaceae TaxID=72275 RepID=UPI0026E2C1E3|nr:MULTISPECIES: hypothetical protein [unclassified Aliiglaciecola]MDO6711777.1 hypothetical protein [Aliiglaciecola sp. 2_MG-2023]MDO6753049.1 hypothetical protein [Aliiglaciecola sp. 1_MG-2023]
MSNKNQAKNENITDPDVSVVYQAQEKPVPTAALDKRILELAKQQASDKVVDVKAPVAKWRKWQWPTSIAASVMFISLVVYNQYDRFDPMLTKAPELRVDTYDIADQATLDNEQLTKKSKLEIRELSSPPVSSRMASEPLLDKSEFVRDSVEEPERAQYAEKEALTLAAKAMDNVEIEPLSFELEMPLEVDVEQQIPADIVLTQEAATEQAFKQAELIAKQQKSQLAKREHQGQTRLSLIESSSMFNDNQPSTSKMQVNTEYLDSLLKQLEEHSAPKNKNADKIQSLSQLQNDIFDYLSLLKMADPLVEIDPKYLQVLTEEQNKKLSE